MDRRTFITTTAAVGTTVVAGCGASSDGSGSDGDGSMDGTSTDSGSITGDFRLLISDQPADISDFDSLDVTFDRARVFRKQSDAETETEATETSTTESDTAESTATETSAATETETTDATETAEMDNEETDDEEEDENGFTVFELDAPTVDLTEVVGDKAIGVLDGKLEVGEYSKIELYVSDVEGVVDGETVPVKVPSNKLQITKSFEVTAEETVEFVFDINVVKKGNGGYNLLPVISKSGVAGEDVEVEEVEDEDDESTEANTQTETEPTEDESSTSTATNETATGA